MKNNTKNLKKYIKDNFIFFNSCIDVEGNDIYFCSCGNKMVTKPDVSTFAMTVEDIDNIDLSDMDTLFRKASVICPKCNSDYTQQGTYSKIQNTDVYFFEKFDVYEDDEKLILFKYRSGAMYESEDKDINIDLRTSYIKILKKSKKIKFKDFGNEYTIKDLEAKDITNFDEVEKTKNALERINESFNSEIKFKQFLNGDRTIIFDSPEQSIHLDNVVDISKKFFTNGKNINITDGFISIHDFVGKLARIIMDAKNMNLIEEISSLMVGKSGVDVLQKVIAIFMAIICYPNLTTIAMTKGNMFLYDLLQNCQLPTPAYLKKNHATSPIKIFNTLVSLKNIEIQEKIDANDFTNKGYVFKAKSGAEKVFKYDVKEFEGMLGDMGVNIGKAKRVDKEGAMAFVRDKIQNQKISPFIFNKLDKFADYERLIQWLGFISYENLTHLVMEYDIDVLNVIYTLIEFRDDINFERLKQFIPLMHSYAAKAISNEYALQNNIKLSHAMSAFDFDMYDDCLRMVLELGWDPNKVLYKIKDVDKLKKFHDDIMKHRSYVTDKDVNRKYIEYAEKFTYLEGNKGNFNIQIIKTPQELLNDAIDMHNCAGSYINKVANGIYVPFILYDNSPERKADEFHKYMMILEVTHLGLDFVGVKSRFNKYGSDRFKKEIMQYLIDNDISFKDVPSIQVGSKSSENAYAGTFAKLETK